MHLVVGSPLGKAFLAVRENDVRASLIGLNVYVVRLVAFVMAGFLAGVAGALFAFFGRYASASYMFYTFSGEAVVWAIVGGGRHLVRARRRRQSFHRDPGGRIDALGAPFADRRRDGDPRRDPGTQRHRRSLA